MVRMRGRNERGWIIALLVVPLLLMSLTGIAFSHWPDYIYIVGKITTRSGGGGTGACIEIQKTLSGAFTDPTTGKDLKTPTNLIRIGSASGITSSGGIACPPTNFPTKFKLCINVTNCGPTLLENVTVKDRLEHQFAPINSTPSDGTDKVVWVYKIDGGSGFKKHFLTWEIGDLEPGEWAALCIWIQTTKNPVGFYEPTSACKDYLVNLGATVVADSEFGGLEATTEGIILKIDGFVQPNIALITTVLPYSTPWANDHIE